MSPEDHILLAEDEEADILLMQLSLEEHGFPAEKVVVTRDGTEALDYLLARGPFAERPLGNPSLVILDLKLPKVNGLEILREIRATPEICKVPVVLFTSSLQDRDREEALKEGADAFVVKPMELDDYIQAIGRMLSLQGR